MSAPVIGDDGLARCPWAAGDPVNRAYHDTEWGQRVSGEAAHLERLTLEAFQSGLSWLTILNKREAFREVFAGFDPDVVAGFSRLRGGGILKVNDSHVRFAPHLPTHGGTGLTGGPFGEANYPVLRTTHLQAVSDATGVLPRASVFDHTGFDEGFDEGFDGFDGRGERA